MADEAADVDAHLAFEIIEILTIAVPVPLNALLKGVAWNGLDPNEAFHHRIFIAFFDRGQCQPAVPHDHCRNAMLRLAGAVRIPEHLRIQMGVVIEETRSDGQTSGIDGAGSAFCQSADFSNLAVFDTDIGNIRRKSGSIDDAP